MLPGTELGGRYRVLRTLGAGGMGQVHVCEDLMLRREVAVKTLPFHQLGSAAAHRRMVREARALAAIEHPGVVRMYDVGTTDDGGVFVVMEVVAGVTLRDRLERGPLEVAEAARLLEGTAEALATVHAAGLVHRDLKPDNLMIRPDGTPVLIDFGLAKRTDADAGPGQREWDTRDLTVTAQGGVVGTPGYLAPEQVQGERPGPLADQFQLAVTFYEALTDDLPWKASTGENMLLRTYAVPPIPITAARPGLPPRLDAVFGRAFAWLPAERYPTVMEFARAFRRAASGEWPEAAGEDGAVGTAPTRESAAERTGSPEATADPASPAPSVADAPVRRTAPRRALLAGAVALGLGAVVASPPARRALWPDAEAEADAAPALPPTLADDDSIACPPFDVAGAGPEKGWLGAAAADAACKRARFSVDGELGRIATPAALAGLPRQPTDDFPVDPFTDPAVLDRARAAADDAAIALVGRVEQRSFDDYRVEVELRVRGVDAGVKASASSPMLWRAVVDAVDDLYAREALPPRAMSDEEAAWVDRDVDAILRGQEDTFALYSGFQVERGCEALDTRLPRSLADKYRPLCNDWSGEADPARRDAPPVAPPEDDRTLARDAPLYATSLDAGGLEALLGRLVAARGRAASDRARAALALAESNVASVAGDVDRARGVALAALRLDPTSPLLWNQVRRLGVVSGDSRGPAWAPAAWTPAYPPAWCGLRRAGAVEDRLPGLERCFALAHRVPWNAMLLVDALLAAGRVADAHAVAASYAGSPPELGFAAAYLDARVLAHRGRIRAAHDRLTEAYGDLPMLGGSFFRQGDATPLNWHLAIAALLGQARTAADRLAARFLYAEPPRWRAFSYHTRTMGVAICLFADPRRRRPCLEDVRARAADAGAPFLAGVEAYQAGAFAYADGDLDRAVEAWRSLLDRAEDFVLPLDALIRAGRLDLVRDHDAVATPRTVGGVSLAEVRRVALLRAEGRAGDADALARDLSARLRSSDTALRFDLGGSSP